MSSSSLQHIGEPTLPINWSKKAFATPLALLSQILTQRDHLSVFDSTGFPVPVLRP